MNLISDIKFVIRLFIKYPSSSLMGIALLGLGLSMSITMFSLVRGILWSSPQVGNSERMVRLEWVNDRQKADFLGYMSRLEYDLIQPRVQSFDTVIGFSGQQTALYYAGSSLSIKRYDLARVSTNFFQALNVEPLLGRTLGDVDGFRNAELTVVISYDVWQEQFGGLKDAIGKAVLLNGVSYSVVGVMPPGFLFPLDKQLWVNWNIFDASKKSRYIDIIGVLKEGVSKTQAEVELESFSKQLQQKHPLEYEYHNKIVIKPYNSSFVDSDLRAILELLSIASLLVFVVACANVSNLVMVRISRRQHELTIRKILGAHRYQIVLQVMLEGLLFSIGGLIVGFVLSISFGPYIWTMFQKSHTSIPYWWGMTNDWRVCLFAVVITLVSIVTSSLAPTIRAVTRQFIGIIQEGARTLSGIFVGNITKVFVAVQIMCLTVLMVVAFFMMVVLDYFTDWDLPFDPNQILTVSLQLNSTAGFSTDQSVDQFYDNVLKELKVLPGVNSVGFSFHEGGIMPLLKIFKIEGRKISKDLNSNYIGSNIVTNGFFDVFGMQPVKGRFFLNSDIEATNKVAVVNQHFVDAHFAGKNPIGKRIQVFRPGGVREISNYKSLWTDWITIVGVAPNIQRKLLPGEQSGDFDEIYMPIKQRRVRGTWLLLNAQGDINDWIEPARRIIHKHAPLLAPKGQYQSVQEVFDKVNSVFKVLTEVVILFGIAALIITVVGLYGLISFTTLLQRREFGIRSALGASGRNVVAMVLKRAVWILGLGLAAGVGIATIISGVLKQNLNVMNLPVEIPSHFIGISIVIVTSVMAIIVPAWQVARVPPNEALRFD